MGQTADALAVLRRGPRGREADNEAANVRRRDGGAGRAVRRRARGGGTARRGGARGGAARVRRARGRGTEHGRAAEVSVLLSGEQLRVDDRRDLGVPVRHRARALRHRRRAGTRAITRELRRGGGGTSEGNDEGRQRRGRVPASVFRRSGVDEFGRRRYGGGSRELGHRREFESGASDLGGPSTEDFDIAARRGRQNSRANSKQNKAHIFSSARALCKIPSPQTRRFYVR